MSISLATDFNRLADVLELFKMVAAIAAIQFLRFKVSNVTKISMTTAPALKHFQSTTVVYFRVPLSPSIHYTHSTSD